MSFLPCEIYWIVQKAARFESTSITVGGRACRANKDLPHADMHGVRVSSIDNYDAPASLPEDSGWAG